MKILPLLLLPLAMLGCGSGSEPARSTAAPATENKAQSPKMVRVLAVAVDKIPPYAPLKDEMFTLIEVPASDNLKDAATSSTDYKGRSLARGLSKGDLLTESNMTQKFSSYDLIDGPLVVTVKPILLPSQKDRIRPNMKVDLFANYLVKKQEAGVEVYVAQTKLIVPQATIFSIDNMRSPTSDNKFKLEQTVSFLLDMDQVGVLIMAEKRGSVTIGIKE